MNAFVSHRTPFKAACLAALSFFVALLVSHASGTGFDPLIHPLGVLGVLPGQEGVFYRVALFGVPALAGGLVVMAGAGHGTDSPLRRIARWLWLIGCAGLAGMAIFRLDVMDPGGAGNRLHATAWLCWLSAWLPGLVLMSLAYFRDRHALAGACSVVVAALAMGLFINAMGLLPPSLSQLGLHVLWLVWLMALAGKCRRKGQGSTSLRN